MGTTCGYGDTYPITPLGKIIASFAMILGVLSVALPTTVLGVQFGDSYALLDEERKREIIAKKVKLRGEEHRSVEIGRQAIELKKSSNDIKKLRAEIDILVIELSQIHNQKGGFGSSGGSSNEDPLL